MGRARTSLNRGRSGIGNERLVFAGGILDVPGPRWSAGIVLSRGCTTPGGAALSAGRFLFEQTRLAAAGSRPGGRADGEARCVGSRYSGNRLVIPFAPP